MLWLIQRDFLEGKTVQDMVSEALQPVANPYEDQDIAQVSYAAVHMEHVHVFQQKQFDQVSNSKSTFVRVMQHIMYMAAISIHVQSAWFAKPCNLPPKDTHACNKGSVLMCSVKYK